MSAHKSSETCHFRTEARDDGKDMAVIEEILESEAIPAAKINNANLTDLKATSNDAIATVLFNP
jgi:hypothetical protein